MSALWCAAIAGALPIALAAPLAAQTAKPAKPAPAAPARPAAESPAVADTVVAATVNGEKIMMAKVNVVLAKIKQRRPEISQDDLDGIRSEIIQELIDERLLIQAAKKEKLMPDKQKIDDAIWNLQKPFPSQAAFDKYLADSGKTKEDLRASLSESMAAESISRHLVRDVAVADDEISKFYSEHKAEFVVPDMMRVRHIQISFPIEISKEGKRVPKALTKEEKSALEKKAQGVLKKAQAGGANFALLAKENSDDKVSARLGGDLGFIARDDIIDKTFGDAVFNTPVGKVNSKLVATKFGYNIIKVEEKKASRTVALTEVSTYIKSLLLQQKIKARMESEIAKLRQAATITNAFPKKAA